VEVRGGWGARGPVRLVRARGGGRAGGIVALSDAGREGGGRRAGAAPLARSRYVIR